MKASEVLTRYAAGERDFRGVNLRGQSFNGQNLKQANFSEADLRSTNFTRADLRGVNFANAKCGLQRRWAILLTISSWLMGIVSGFLSIFTGLLVSLVFDFSNQENQISGFTGLLVLLVFLISTIRRGIRAGAVTGAVVVAVIVAIAVTGVGLGTEASIGVGLGAGSVIGAVAFAGVVAITISVANAVTVALAFAGVIAVAVTIIITVLVSIAISVTIAVKIAVTATIAFAIVVAGVAVYISWRAIKGDAKDTWLRSCAIAFAAIGGTSFRGADLTEADFTGTILKSTDIRKAILARVCWRDAQKINFVRPGKTYLINLSLRQLLITGKAQNQNFDRQDLRGVNLSKANLENASFIDADFYQANLQGANLSRTILVRANFERADLRNANLTGSCIQDWVITESTKLDGITCDCVYLKWINGDKRDQMPPRGKFGEGGFVTYERSILETVELYHEKDINPRLALTVLQKMSRDYDEPFDIVALGKKGERVFVQVKVSEHIAQENFKDDYYSRYDTGLKLWSGNNHQLPPAVNSFIEKRISEIASEKTDDFVFVDAKYAEGNYTEIYQGEVNMSGDRNINAETYYEQSGKFGIGHMSGGEIKDNAKVAGVINEAEQQNLADAATEIQTLLEQLSKNHPTTTSKEKNIVVGEAVDRIENNPPLKAKVINALKAGGTEAFKEAIDHPLVNILVATIEGWQDAE